MLTLKNPYIMAPVKLGYTNKDGKVNQRHIDFYVLRSKHVAAVTLEPLYLDSQLRELPTQLGIDNDDKIEGLQSIVNTIHTAGAQVIAHLNHPGRMANPKIPNNYFVSSSAKACENGGVLPQAIDEEGMHIVCEQFSAAALRAEKAGIDIIELQMGHGYLLAQFLSPAVNTRIDHYGGSFENRIRFPLRVLDAIQDTVSLPIIIRLSAEEMIPNGIKIEETIALVKLLESKGVDAVHISAGSLCSTPPWYFQHMFVPKGKTWEWAAKIGKQTSLPVISVGQINAYEDLKTLIHLDIDYIAIGRALIADPDFVGKLTGSVNDPIRPCMSCADGCLGGVKSGKGLGCIINPHVGNALPSPKQAIESKKYAVVGGGIAGMEAALTLNKRGYHVDLYEAKELGGQFILAPLPPHKKNLEKMITYYKEAIHNSHISVIHKEAITEDLIAHYDTAVLATGSIPFIPPIKGLKEFSWAESLQDETLKEKHILIIGGGLIGVEVASKLLEQNNQITIVEMLDEIANGMEMIERSMTLKKLSVPQVKIFTGHKVLSIKENSAIIQGEAQHIIEAIDHIIIATGMQSYHPLKESLENKMNVVCIGDAKQVGKVQDAIHNAYITACTL
jgi:2,4-dienoyl-CoA reductase-like NADH-dependent reductase (Old Yellow Enzyme family)/thioredoxin reductase